MDTVNTIVSGSYTDYAKHRGVSKAAVSKMKKKPWFAPAIGRRDGKEYITDFALADRLWTHHVDPTRASNEEKERLSRIAHVTAPPADGDSTDAPPVLSLEMSLADAVKADKYWSAMKKRQEFERTAGVLVNAEHRDLEEATRVTFAKTRLLGIPTKLKARLPHLAHGDIAVIDALIREALEELADESKKAHGEAA